MPISDEPDAYQTYLLRLWRVQCQGRWQWRASLESPHTGERQLFAGLGQLFVFLSERCADQVPDVPQEEKEVQPLAWKSTHSSRSSL